MARVFFSQEYVSAGHSFETTRKSAWVADSLARSPISAIEIVTPSPLRASQVAEVHAVEYVEAVRTGAPRRSAAAR